MPRLVDSFEEDDLDFKFGQIVDCHDRPLQIECQIVDVEDGQVIAIGWGRNQNSALDDAIDSWELLAEFSGLVQA